MKQKINKLKQIIRKNLKWIVLFICLIIFISIVEDVFDKEIMEADKQGYQFIANNLISDNVTPIAMIITNLGGTVVLITLTVVLLLAIKNKKIGISIVTNLLIVTGLNLLLKNIVQRPRPDEYRMIAETGYSFPSGHSMISMAFYGYLIYLISKHFKNKKLKTFLIIALSMLIISIGTSRIYIGVHYTSDVLAGFAISISYLIIYTSVAKKFLVEREEKDGVEKQENNK